MSDGADIPILKAKNHTKTTPSNQKIICHTQIEGIPNDKLSTLFGFPNIRFPINKPGPIEKDMSVSEAEVQMIDQYSKNIDMQDIGLFWQLTIKTIDDLRIIGNENLTLEMYIMQLVHLKNIDTKKKEILGTDIKSYLNGSIKNSRPIIISMITRCMIFKH